MNNLETNIRNFWDYKHSIKDTDSLSGCKYDETIDFLQIRNMITEGLNVLEIGVGFGFVTKGLFDNGINVSAIDISNLALNNVSKYCENVYNVNDINNLPSNYFDVIICNNVVQHVPTEQLIIELKEILRSLKSNGIFAVEFVSSDSFDDNGINPILENIQGGKLCRTPVFFEKILNSLDAKCKLVFDRKINVDIIKGHHVFHVKKNNKI